MRPPAFCTITVSLYKLKAMFAFVSKTVNFREFLDEFALALQMPVIDNRIKLPEHFGKGYFCSRGITEWPAKFLRMETYDSILEESFL